MKKIVVILMTMVMLMLIGNASAETWPDDIHYFQWIDTFSETWPDGSPVDYHKIRVNYYEGCSIYDYVNYVVDKLPITIVQQTGEIEVITDTEDLVLETGENYVVFLQPKRNYLEYDDCAYKYDWIEFAVLYY